MAVNKVEINGEVKLDLTADTVTPSDLKKGVTAHSKSGAVITGTLEVPAIQEKTVELNMRWQTDRIYPDNGYDAMDMVTIVRPDTFVPENIKKGVNIGGVVGTLNAAQRETWVWNNSTLSQPSSALYVELRGVLLIEFISDGDQYIGLYYENNNLYYKKDGEASTSHPVYVRSANYWVQDLRKITFIDAPSGDLLTWLQANAVKQPSDSALQPSKALTVTSNGTVSITPDAPYDAMQKVDLTVNVAEGSGKAVTVTIKREPFDQWIQGNSYSIASSSPDGAIITDAWNTPVSSDKVYTCLDGSLFMWTNGFYGFQIESGTPKANIYTLTHGELSGVQLDGDLVLVPYNGQ